MPTKFVSVTFTRQETKQVYAQVKTDLSGAALEEKVVISHEWMQEHFGGDWDRWEIEDIAEVTDEWAILRDQHANPEFYNDLNQAPLFEIAKDECVTNETPPSYESLILSEDEFEKLYPLIENHLNPNASWSVGNGRGCLFETFGDELEFVKSQDPSKVWTLVDCDEGSCIISGFHFVNRVGYLISTVPVGPNVNVEVQFEANEPHEDDEDESDEDDNDESEANCPLD